MNIPHAILQGATCVIAIDVLDNAFLSSGYESNLITDDKFCGFHGLVREKVVGMWNDVAKIMELAIKNSSIGDVVVIRLARTGDFTNRMEVVPTLTKAFFLRNDANECKFKSSGEMEGFYFHSCGEFEF